jgi:hypothetical protein
MKVSNALSMAPHSPTVLPINSFSFASSTTIIVV